jgi:hypothetical protein
VHVFGLAVGERRVPAPPDSLVCRQPPRPLPLEEEDGLCQGAAVVGRAQTTAANKAAASSIHTTGTTAAVVVVSSKAYTSAHHQCHGEHPHLHRHASSI